MAGDPIYNPYDATRITNTSSSSYGGTIIISNIYHSSQYVQQKQVPKKSKKEMAKERAENLHKLSFIMVNEFKPKVFQVIGYPMKSRPKPYHKNYALH